MAQDIRVQIDNVRVTFMHVPEDDKALINAGFAEFLKTKDFRAAYASTILLLRKSLKTIDGLKDSSGNPYSIDFCDDDSSNIELGKILLEKSPLHEKIGSIALQIMNGSRSNFHDQYGQLITGVRLLPDLSLLN